MVASNNAIYNTVGASISGVTNTLTVTNPSNTASSAARETISVGGGTAGDPTINWNVSGVTNWEMGIDNSVSDNLTISQGTALGTNDTWRMTTAGQRTMPLQCSFLYTAIAQANVTGDGSTYTIVYATKVFDQSNNFDGISTFTAPVTGIYCLGAINSIVGFTAAHNQMDLTLVTSAGSYIQDTKNPYNCSSAGGSFYKSSNSFLIKLTAGQTAIFRILVGVGTKTVSITGGANIFGYLVC